jgi:hypothetical protein
LKRHVLLTHIISGFQGAFARSIQIVAHLDLLNRFYKFRQPMKAYIYQHIPDLREPSNSPDRHQKYASKDL